MQKYLEGSFVYKFFAAICLAIGNHWRKSHVLDWFLAPGKGKAASDNSIFARAWRAFHRGLCFVFEKLRLNKLLRGSIFTMPLIWGFAAVVLAPLIPTMALLALAIMGTATLVIAFACERERVLSYSPTNKYILIYSFVYIMATFTSVYVAGSLYSGMLTSFFVLFAIIIQNAVRTRRQLDMLIYSAVAAGVLVSAYGVFQYVFGAVGAAAWLDSEMFSEIGVRVFSTLGNPNVLAKYLLLIIPFAFACVLTVKGKLTRLGFICALGAMLLCMLLTFSRGGWLGLIAAIAVFLVLLDRRFILLGLVGIIVLYFALPDVILDRFFSIGDIGDTSTSYRLSIWLATIAMLRDFWFTGIGPGTAAFNRVYPLYSFNTVVSPHSHNLYLQVMCDAGIVGISVFLIVLFSFFRNLFSSMSRESDRTSKIFQIAAISSIFGFLVQGMTDYSFYNYRVTFMFWAMLGVGALCARRMTLNHSE